ncbi:MAG: ABC transporter ATP-binding protein/permease [Acholeplasmatales bacterium]|nr:ABC transporter ATP-binding protein/permease [Acholeplasmatales bacterium]
MSKKLPNKYNKRGLLRRTLPYIIQNKIKIFICIILALAIALLTTYMPRITKRILDDYVATSSSFEEVEYDAVLRLLMLYLGATFIVVVLRYSLNFILNLTGMKIERAIREDAIRKIDYLPVDYYALEPDGKIVAKITSDSAGVRTFFTVQFSIAQAIVNIIALFVGFIILDYRLALILLCSLPIILLWITLYRKKIHAYYQDIRETSSRITGKLNELISGTLIIQAFNQEKYMLKDYTDLVDRYNYMQTKANSINAYLGIELLEFIKRLLVAAIILFFGIQFLDTTDLATVAVTAGMITTFTDYLDKMINPINTIFNNLNELEDSIVAANRVYMFLDEENDTHVFDGKEAPNVINGDVEFKNVHFSYVEKKEVLHGINLHVESGCSVGIVGHTGSGKSSLMNLLLRYNDYQEGKILIDKEEITKFNKQSYRKNLGIVLQTPSLFAGTLKSNVTMEREYSDQEVIDVLKEVGAGYMIDKNPLGIYQPISFRGENLSLGEKQLISFARILLRNPKILVLDEATSNIDTETELLIKKAMDVVKTGRTTFIIAHRLSTIKNCDRIIVLDHGVIVGEGSHDELYSTCSVYKDMYDSQYKTIEEYENKTKYGLI